MSLKKFSIALFVTAAVVLPGISLAQTAPWWCSPQFASWWGTTSCNTTYGGAGLLVYVYLPNQNQYGATFQSPADFSVAVSGNTPTPATFPGSTTGTPVLLGSGTYSVALTGNAFNYTPSYSQGCSGTIAAGQNALCVITLTQSTGYYGYPTPYQGSYHQTPVTCSPSYQTVAAGQTARFEALGGYGPYTWTTAERTYLNVGSVLSVALMHTGTQTVVVQGSLGSASCTVNVVANGGAIIYPTTTPGTPLTTYTYPTSLYASQNNYTVSGTSYTSTYVPRLANTGFAPVSAMSIAFAVVGLIGAALVAAPYVRKTLAATGI